MYEGIFREVGLSVNEARVYEALMKMKEGSVIELSIKSKVHRRNVYDSLEKLIDRGLASEVFHEGRKLYKAMNPSRLLDLLREKEKRVESALPQMQKVFGKEQPKEEAYLYRGIQGFKNYLQDILEVGETVYFIGAKAFWLDPRLKHFLLRFDHERKRKGIKFMHLFDYEVKKEKPEILKVVGKPYRFLPKEYSSKTAVDIFGDRVVTFVGVKPGFLPEELVQFIMRSRELADGYRRYFQFMWDKCK